jgi:hypothetical protein
MKTREIVETLPQGFLVGINFKDAYEGQISPSVEYVSVVGKDMGEAIVKTVAKFPDAKIVDVKSQWKVLL